MEKIIDAIGCSDLTIRGVFRIGVPFQELINAVKDEGADLMVMGQKGRSDLAGVLFGSNAEKVFRRCPSPLLSVRPKKKLKVELEHANNGPPGEPPSFRPPDEVGDLHPSILRQYRILLHNRTSGRRNRAANLLWILQ